MADIINIKNGEKLHQSCAVELKTPFNFGLQASTTMPPVKQKRTWFQWYLYQTWDLRRFWRNLSINLIDFLDRPRSRALAAQITALGLRLNRPDFCVMINLSGHVNRFSVDLYPHGYDPACKITLFEDYLPGYPHSGSTPRILRKVIKAMIMYSNVSKLYP